MQVINLNKHGVVRDTVARYVMSETREDGLTYSGASYTVAELAEQFSASEQHSIVALLRELNARGTRKYSAVQLVHTSGGWYEIAV